MPKASRVVDAWRTVTGDCRAAGYQPEELDAFPLTVVSIIRSSRTLQAHTCKRRNVSFEGANEISGIGSLGAYSIGLPLNVNVTKVMFLPRQRL